MKIRFSEHIKFRLRTRGISEFLVKKIYLEADNRYYDTETEYFIAIKKLKFESKQRNIMVAYIEDGEEILLLTVHPLKPSQKENRIKRKRWKKI